MYGGIFPLKLKEAVYKSYLRPVNEDVFTLKPAKGRRHPAVTLTALTYADDVAITSDSASSAKKLYAGSNFIQRR